MDKIKKIFTFLILILTIVFQFFLLTILFTAISPDEKRNEKNALMHYTSKGNFDYKVYLKPNEFIEDDYLPSDDAYLLDLIDYIDLYYKYNFSSTKKTKVSGTNKLKIQLVVLYKEYGSQGNKTEVLNKETTLKEQEIFFENTEYGYENNYKLYLEEYLKILEEFQNQMKISMEGYLEITSLTDFSGSIDETRYFDSYSNKLKIPLSSSVVKIDNNKESKQLSTVYKNIIEKPNKLFLTYSIISNIIVFIIICYLIKKVFFNEEKSEYEEKLDKILKNYDDIIVNVNNFVDISNYKIVNIKEFKEILNLSRELLLPIMNYEVIEKKETWFYIIKDDIMYVYIVK